MAKDVYTTCIFKYLQEHNGENIFIKDITAEYKITKPTVISRLKKLVDEKFVEKEGKRYFVLREF